MSRDYPTNSDNVIDVRDVIKRVEELRDEKKPKLVVGFNMPGYMPDSEPHVAFGWEEARKALIYLLDEAAGQVEEEIVTALENEQGSEVLGEQATALRDLITKLENDDVEEDVGVTVGKYHYFMTDTGEEEIEDESDREELAKLEALLEQLEGRGGDEQWEGSWYPITLVADSYFTEYAQQLAEEIGAINSEASWPANCIDWERAARELRIDYSTVDFDGETYWYR